MTRFVVGPVAEIPPGTVKIVEPEPGRAGLGVFNVGGSFYALRNVCPHMSAPLCRGRIQGAVQPRTTPSGAFDVEWTREGEILRCPWHGWEFEIPTGRTVLPSRSRARTYQLSIETPDVEERLRKGVETVPVVVEESTVVLLLD